MSVKSWTKGLKFDKDPDAVINYVFDWSQYLNSGETISSISVTAETGLTLDSSSNTTTNATAWVSGGTAGKVYTLTCQITTTSGRTDQRSIFLRIVEL